MCGVGVEQAQTAKNAAVKLIFNELILIVYFATMAREQNLTKTKIKTVKC